MLNREGLHDENWKRRFVSLEAIKSPTAYKLKRAIPPTCLSRSLDAQVLDRVTCNCNGASPQREAKMGE